MVSGHVVDVLQHQVDVLEEHLLAPVPGPVLVALELALLHHSVEHEDGAAALLPDRQPEVAHGGGQGTLGQDVAAAGAGGLGEDTPDVRRAPNETKTTVFLPRREKH